MVHYMVHHTVHYTVHSMVHSLVRHGTAAAIADERRAAARRADQPLGPGRCRRPGRRD